MFRGTKVTTLKASGAAFLRRTPDTCKVRSICLATKPEKLPLCASRRLQLAARRPLAVITWALECKQWRNYAVAAEETRKGVVSLRSPGGHFISEGNKPLNVGLN